MQNILTKTAEKLIPSWIHSRLIRDVDKDGAKKYAANTAWMFGARIFSFVTSFFIVALVARYLGPENLGKLSYAQSFVAIFSAFASMGIDTILSRDLVAHPEKEHQILGTSFIIKLIFGTVTAIVTTFVAFFTNADKTLAILILILSLPFIIGPFGISGQVFNARVKAKYSSLIQIVISVVIPLLKLAIIFLGKGILYFAVLFVIEAIINAGLSFYFYTRVFKHHPLQWTFNFSYAKTLLASSAPLLFAGISSYLFAKIDQVMLQHMIGSEVVGVYSVAGTLTDMAGLFTGILIGSLFPAIVTAYKTDTNLYHKRLRQLFYLVLTLNFLSTVALLAVSPFLIPILYGAAFTGSISIIAIFAWKLTAVTFPLIAQQHLIIENMTKTYLFASMATATLNIALNYILIPTYGAHGAAIATVISYLSYIAFLLCLPAVRLKYAEIFGIRNSVIH